MWGRWRKRRSDDESNQDYGSHPDNEVGTLVGWVSRIGFGESGTMLRTEETGEVFGYAPAEVRIEIILADDTTRTLVAYGPQATVVTNFVRADMLRSVGSGEPPRYAFDYKIVDGDYLITRVQAVVG